MASGLDGYEMEDGAGGASWRELVFVHARGRRVVQARGGGIWRLRVVRIEERHDVIDYTLLYLSSCRLRLGLGAQRLGGRNE